MYYIDIVNERSRCNKKKTPKEEKLSKSLTISKLFKFHKFMNQIEQL